MSQAEQEVSRVVGEYGMAGVIAVLMDLYGEARIRSAVAQATYDAANLPQRPYDTGS